MGGADRLAVLIALGSLLFALAMLLVMLALLLRRRRQEHVAGQREADRLVASRAFLSILQGGDPEQLRQAPQPAQRAALTHLLHLLRGDERHRLLKAAEARGLFAEPLARLGRGTPARRIDAVRTLEQFASPGCVAALHRTLFADCAPEVRLEAAAALARLGRTPPVRDLVEALGLNRRAPTRLDAALFRSLANRDADEIELLAVEARAPGLKALLVEAIGWTGDYARGPGLAAFASDGNADVRAAAVRAARRLGHPGVGAWLVPLLDDDAEPVRIHAAQTCGELGLNAAVPRLERLATEPSWWVRTRARDALARLRPGGGPRLALAGAPA